MRSLRTFVAFLLLVSLLAGCYAVQYKMGNGPQTGQTDSARQWYILWGLIPINSVDVQGMVGTTKDYQVRVAWEPTDVAINIVLGSFITVYSQSVTVKK
ncbi:MAG: hypothetical protein FJY65_04215 [Calditrichaeota bacterium]|nr:hypothetical protein [Calditrichota bacterium]